MILVNIADGKNSLVKLIRITALYDGLDCVLKLVRVFWFDSTGEEDHSSIIDGQHNIKSNWLDLHHPAWGQGGCGGGRVGQSQ